MVKTSEKEIVKKIAEKEIEGFIKEWIKYPYAWESETDIHAELYIRIKSALRRRIPLTKCKYYEMVSEEYFDSIYCKPRIIFKRANFPDIVIFGELNPKVKDRENEPISWVCEIKYFTDWSSSLSVENVKKDIKKLEYLLRNGADYGAYIILQRTKKRKSGLNRVLYRDLQLNKNNKIQKILKKAENENSKLKLYRYSTGYK